MQRENVAQYLPTPVLVISTTIALITALLIIVAFWFRTARLNRGDVKRQVSQLEKRLILVHYAICLPLFELMVVWGPRFSASIKPSSPPVVLAWISVLLASLLSLVIAYFSRKNYRMMVHVALILQFPCMSFAFGDRLFRGVLGAEGMIISALIVCGIVEIFTVPDFFHPDSQRHRDYEMANSVHYTSDPELYEQDMHKRYEECDAEDSGFVSDYGEGRGVTALASDKRAREQVVSAVLQKIANANLNAGANEMRDTLRWCQDQIVAVFAHPTKLPSASSASESVHDGLPWNQHSYRKSHSNSSNRGAGVDMQISPRAPVRGSRNFERSFDEEEEF